MVSLIVLNYNDSDTTTKFIRRIKEYKCFDKIVVVDNMSTDGSYEELSELSSEKIVILSSQKNGGYGFGNNFGIRYILENKINNIVAISNPDVIFTENTILELEKEIRENEDVGVVAPVMKNKDGVVENNCAWKLPKSAWNYVMGFAPFFHKLYPSIYYGNLALMHGKMEVDAVAGSLLMIDANVFEQAGLYDENIFLYCEEDSVGMKMRKSNKKTVLLLDEYFLHVHSVSIGKVLKRKWEQEKKIWKSREIILKKYYRLDKIQMLMYRILANLVVLYNRMWVK